MKLLRQSILAATVAMIVATTLSRLLGFARETVIAYFFGATASTDAYLVALIFPNLLSGLAVGAIASAFVTVFTEYKTKNGEEEAWRIGRAVIGCSFILLLAGIVLILLLAPFLIRLVTPGLAPETAALAARLTRILAPATLFLGLTALFTAVMHAYRHFIVPAFSGLAINFCLIACAVALEARFGVTALAVGWFIGTFMQFALLFSPLVLEKPLLKVRRSDFSHPGFRKCMSLSLPVLVGTVAGQINLLIDRALASGLAEGSIAALNFAVRVIDLPAGLFTASLAGAVYPAMAQLATEENRDDLRRTFAQSLRMLWLVIIPAAMGLVALREPVVRLLFERGAFGVAATQMTAVALAFYAPWLVATAGIALLGRVYFAMQDTLTPLKTGLLVILLNVALNLILIRHLAHGGLALATSIAAAVNLLLLLRGLRRKLNYLEGRKTAVATLKITLSSLAMSGAAVLIYRQTALIWSGAGVLPQALRLGSAITVGLLVYPTLLALLRLEELAVLKTILLSRVLRIRSATARGRAS